jgi:glycosyltransferase involved in cell wall biosynthesis
MKSINNVKVLLCQLGARHRYELAKILSDNNNLFKLYTDSSSESLLFKFLSFFGLNINRKISIDRKKIISTDVSIDIDISKRKSHITYIINKSKRLSRYFIKFHNKTSFDILFVMYNEFSDLVKYYKLRNKKIIVDVFISPLTYKIMNEEIEKWDLKKYGYETYNENEIIRSLESNFNNADIITCPSKWVKEGILYYFPSICNKIRIIPYGSTLRVNKVDFNKRESQTFLFVGNDAFRKGLLYLSEASSILKLKYPEIKFKVAGNFNNQIKSDRKFSNLIFLGKLNKKKLIEEYKNCSAFVFPSLSEGFAATLVEAMSNGAPIITTVESGSNIIHKENGLVIKSRSSSDIVEKIALFLENPNLRIKLYNNSYILAKDYSIENWKQSIKNILHE